MGTERNGYFTRGRVVSESAMNEYVKLAARLLEGLTKSRVYLEHSVSIYTAHHPSTLLFPSSDHQISLFHLHFTLIISPLTGGPSPTSGPSHIHCVSFSSLTRYFIVKRSTVEK